MDLNPFFEVGLTLEAMDAIEVSLPSESYLLHNQKTEGIRKTVVYSSRQWKHAW